jgi:hypothetical protein
VIGLAVVIQAAIGVAVVTGVVVAVTIGGKVEAVI